jgi:hypothetical protein
MYCMYCDTKLIRDLIFIKSLSDKININYYWFTNIPFNISFIWTLDQTLIVIK